MNPKARVFPGNESEGLTIRDYIAIEAMKSLISFKHLGSVDCARQAYIYADVLIAQSNKK